MHIAQTMMARAIPFIPHALVKRISRRYIAGATLREALAVVQRLNSKGFGVTLDILGESAQTAAEADVMEAAYHAVLRGISLNAADAEISVKPTALGLLNDGAACMARHERILAAACELQIGACLDMEDSRCTAMEIELFEHLQPRTQNLGLAVQAYLKRSYSDLERLLFSGSRLRICKGIYLEDEAHLVRDAGQDRSAINRHFLAHVDRCFEKGVFVSVATHDEQLIDAVIETTRRKNVPASAFEFQMLLGVCEPLRDRIRNLGFAVRIYVPYGADWYGYSTRRLKENPRIAGYVFRAMLGL